MGLMADVKAVYRSARDGRSYWVAEFGGGRLVREWERDWTEMKKKGMRELSLYCPNGQVGRVGVKNGGTMDDRVFQFKVTVRRTDGLRLTQAHVIGIITDARTFRSQCYAWEWPGQLVAFEDSYTNGGVQRYGAVTARLEPDVVGIPSS